MISIYASVYSYADIFPPFLPGYPADNAGVTRASDVVKITSKFPKWYSKRLLIYSVKMLKISITNSI